MFCHRAPLALVLGALYLTACSSGGSQSPGIPTNNIGAASAAQADETLSWSPDPVHVKFSGERAEAKLSFGPKRFDDLRSLISCGNVSFHVGDTRKQAQGLFYKPVVLIAHDPTKPICTLSATSESSQNLTAQLIIEIQR
jgi:hypothetical protein